MRNLLWYVSIFLLGARAQVQTNTELKKALFQNCTTFAEKMFCYPELSELPSITIAKNQAIIANPKTSFLEKVTLEVANKNLACEQENLAHIASTEFFKQVDVIVFERTLYENPQFIYNIDPVKDLGLVVAIIPLSGVGCVRSHGNKLIDRQEKLSSLIEMLENGSHHFEKARDLRPTSPRGLSELSQKVLREEVTELDKLLRVDIFSCEGQFKTVVESYHTKTTPIEPRRLKDLAEQQRMANNYWKEIDKELDELFLYNQNEQENLITVLKYIPDSQFTFEGGVLYYKNKPISFEQVVRASNIEQKISHELIEEGYDSNGGWGDHEKGNYYDELNSRFNQQTGLDAQIRGDFNMLNHQLSGVKMRLLQDAFPLPPDKTYQQTIDGVIITDQNGPRMGSY